VMIYWLIRIRVANGVVTRVPRATFFAAQRDVSGEIQRELHGLLSPAAQAGNQPGATSRSDAEC
jgi:hypothetical protein